MYLLSDLIEKNEQKSLIDSSSKINTSILAYIVKLRLKICHINIRAFNIYSYIFKIFKIVLASFQINYKIKMI